MVSSDGNDNPHDNETSEGDETCIVQETILKPIRTSETSTSAITRVWAYIFNPKQKQVHKASRRRKWSIRALWWFGLPVYISMSVVLAWFILVAQDMPNTSALWAPKSTPLIVIQDRHGRELLRSGGAEAEAVDLSEVPIALTNAIIAIEDRRYYHHPGFDIVAFGRAMRANYKAGKVVQGGSTLTQQLAKNVFLTRDQTIKRKSQEMLLSLWLEHRLSKTEILETYLSRVYFGGGTVGIGSGARRFFNKPTQALTLGESALLAGLLQAPARLNPVKNTRANARRTAKVLMEMHKQKYLSELELQNAMIALIEVEPTPIQKVASTQYFTDWILTRIDEEIGVPRQDIIVHTSLDKTAQLAAQAAVARGVNTKRNAQQASLVSFDGTGGVRAMVGGTSYVHSSYNRVLRAQRQPGSVFKPFVYLAALQSGISPWETRIDAPIDIKGWKPSNFSNKFAGEMTVETALALSINTIAVILSEEIGRQAVVDTAIMMGMAKYKPYASLALGAQETNLYQLTAAYIPFANWGYKIEPHGLEAIYGTNGEVFYERTVPEKIRILDVKILGQMNTMMQTVVLHGTGKAARLNGRDVAGKTGTTNDYRDAWFIGYTPDIVTGVWVGNDDNSKMSRITGGSIPARIWSEFMEETLIGVVATQLPKATRPKLVPSKIVSPVDKETRQTLEELLADVEKSFQ